VLKKGDHGFIKVDSYVAYSFCRIESAAKLVAGVKMALLSIKACSMKKYLSVYLLA
jgi:hypothetical protein